MEQLCLPKASNRLVAATKLVLEKEIKQTKKAHKKNGKITSFNFIVLMFNIIT